MTIAPAYTDLNAHFLFRDNGQQVKIFIIKGTLYGHDKLSEIEKEFINQNYIPCLNL